MNNTPLRVLFAGIVVASTLFVYLTSMQLPDPVASQFDMGGKAIEANARVPPQFNNTFLFAAGGLFVAWVIAAAVTLSLHFRRTA